MPVVRYIGEKPRTVVLSGVGRLRLEFMQEVDLPQSAVDSLRIMNGREKIPLYDILDEGVQEEISDLIKICADTLPEPPKRMFQQPLSPEEKKRRADKARETRKKNDATRKKNPQPDIFSRK